jgi:hypothetical protein
VKENELILIENEGALFRGRVVKMPAEVWSFKDNKWKPYKGEVPKSFTWGQEVDQTYANELKRDYREARKEQLKRKINI